MAGRFDVVLRCWPARSSKRVVVDRAEAVHRSRRRLGHWIPWARKMISWIAHSRPSLDATGTDTKSV